MRGEGAVEPAHVDVLAPGEQRLRQVRRPVEAVVPPSLRGGEAVVALQRDHDVEDREFAHRVAVGGGERVGHRPAPIVPGEQEAVMAERAVHELPDVLGDPRLAVAAGGARRPAQAAQVRRDDAVARGERRHDAPPCEPGLRKPVQQYQRLPRARGGVVHGHFGERGETVLRARLRRAGRLTGPGRCGIRGHARRGRRRAWAAG